MAPTKKKLNKNLRKARIRSKIQGTAQKPRLTIFKSLQHNYAQLIDDDKGVTIAAASDIKDKKGSAKKIGLKIAELAEEKKVTVCVFDRNGYKYHGRVKEIAEGAREGGLKF